MLAGENPGEENAMMGANEIRDLKNKVAHDICITLQGHDFGRLVEGIEEGEVDAFHTTPAQIELLEKLCKDAAEKVVDRVGVATQESLLRDVIVACQAEYSGKNTEETPFGSGWKLCAVHLTDTFRRMLSAVGKLQ